MHPDLSGVINSRNDDIVHGALTYTEDICIHGSNYPSNDVLIHGATYSEENGPQAITAITQGLSSDATASSRKGVLKTKMVQVKPVNVESNCPPAFLIEESDDSHCTKVMDYNQARKF